MRTSTTWPARSEVGAATVLALAWILVLAAMAWAGMLIAAAAARQHHVDGAADVVAVSAASRLQRGDDACAVASDFASRNEVVLRLCRVDGDDVVIAVSDRISVGFGIRRDLVGQARAGPS